MEVMSLFRGGGKWSMCRATQGLFLVIRNFIPWKYNHLPTRVVIFAPPAVPEVKIGNVIANSRHRQRIPFIEESLVCQERLGPALVLLATLKLGDDDCEA